MKKGQFTIPGGRHSFAISISPDLLEGLRQAAKEEEESASAIVRKALKAYLAQRQAQRRD